MDIASLMAEYEKTAEELEDLKIRYIETEKKELVLGRLIDLLEQARIYFDANPRNGVDLSVLVAYERLEGDGLETTSHQKSDRLFKLLCEMLGIKVSPIPISIVRGENKMTKIEEIYTVPVSLIKENDIDIDKTFDEAFKLLREKKTEN